MHGLKLTRATSLFMLSWGQGRLQYFRCAYKYKQTGAVPMRYYGKYSWLGKAQKLKAETFILKAFPWLQYWKLVLLISGDVETNPGPPRMTSEQINKVAGGLLGEHSLLIIIKPCAYTAYAGGGGQLQHHVYSVCMLHWVPQRYLFNIRYTKVLAPFGVRMRNWQTWFPRETPLQYNDPSVHRR